MIRRASGSMSSREIGWPGSTTRLVLSAEAGAQCLAEEGAGHEGALERDGAQGVPAPPAPKCEGADEEINQRQHKIFAQDDGDEGQQNEEQRKVFAHALGRD